jgi:hypothetical protein
MFTWQDPRTYHKQKGGAGLLNSNKSEVAYFREQQALQEEAAQRGMSGLAAVACHAMITARMERGAERILRLIQEGRHEEAQRLMATDAWGLDEKEEEGQ